MPQGKSLLRGTSHRYGAIIRRGCREEIGKIHRLLKKIDGDTGLIFAWSSLLNLALAQFGPGEADAEMAVLTDDCMRTFASWRFADKILLQ